MREKARGWKVEKWRKKKDKNKTFYSGNCFVIDEKDSFFLVVVAAVFISFLLF